MTDITNTAGEVLDNGENSYPVADFGSFTAQSLVFTGGTIEEDFSSRTYRVGTYATPILPGDAVKAKTGTDDTDINVERVSSGDNGDVLWGFFKKWRGKAGDTSHDAMIYEPGDGDIMVFEAGSEVDSTNITVSDSVSFSGDGFDRDAYYHGLRVQQDNTNGIGYALNQVTASGEVVKVKLRPGLQS